MSKSVHTACIVRIAYTTFTLVAERPRSEALSHCTLGATTSEQLLFALDRVRGTCVPATTHAQPIARRRTPIAIAALKFRKGDALHLDETRQGYVVCSGSADEFRERELRTTLRVTIEAKPQDKAVAMVKIVDVSSW